MCTCKHPPTKKRDDQEYIKNWFKLAIYVSQKNLYNCMCEKRMNPQKPSVKHTSVEKSYIDIIILTGKKNLIPKHFIILLSSS